MCYYDLYRFACLCTSALPSLPISSPGLSRSIFELLFGLLRACAEDLASLACYAPMCVTRVYIVRGQGVIKTIYALLFYLSFARPSTSWLYEFFRNLTTISAHFEQ